MNTLSQIDALLRDLEKPSNRFTAMSDDAKSGESRFVLGYWKIRGLAAPARYLLTYAGAVFEDVYYEQGEAPEYSRTEWLDAKFQQGLDFPNVPWLEDREAGIKITQSAVIMRYVGRLYGVGGYKSNDPKALAIEEMLQGALEDLRSRFAGWCYGRSQQPVEKYVSQATARWENFEEFLSGGNKFNPRNDGKVKKWFGGDEICVADFWIYEMLDAHLMLEKTIFDKYPNLLRVHRQFRELPQLREYLAKAPASGFPLNNKVAKHFG